MIDWLAEQYVIQLARWVLFFANPTSCLRIINFQAWTLILALLWALRIGYLSRRAHEFSDQDAAAPSTQPRLETAARRARRKLGRCATFSWSRALVRRRLRGLSILVPRSSSVILCNTGFLHPVIVISPRAITLLDDDELEATVAHEMAHVLHRDNLVRALAEGAAFVAPPLIWWYASLDMVVGSAVEFMATFLTGLLVGLLIRLTVVPLLSYWQERRCDEWAGTIVRDRLVVASALVKIGREISGQSDIRVSPVVAPFALFHSQVLRRAVRLLRGSGKLLIGVDRWGSRGIKLLLAVAVGLGFLAAQRAASRELQARVTIVPGLGAGIDVTEGLDIVGSGNSFAFKGLRLDPGECRIFFNHSRVDRVSHLPWLGCMQKPQECSLVAGLFTRETTRLRPEGEPR